MFKVFEGGTADEVWLNIASVFREGREISRQGSRAGPTHELLRAAITIKDPTQRWVVSREPPINPAFAIAEVVWMMAGRNDSQFPNYFNRELPKYAGTGASYHGAYGYRLRHHLSVDQIGRAFDVLRNKPDSRQVVLQIWDARLDLPHPSGEEASADIPCNVLSMLKVREGKLEWTQVMRSNDLWRGLPHNLVQFTSLQEILAGWLNLELGDYNHLSDSLHVYDDKFQHVVNSRPVPMGSNEDSLALPKGETEATFAELARCVDRIIDDSTTPDELVTMIRKSELPKGYRNLLAVLSAEGARRRKSGEAMEAGLERCTNPLLRLLFDRWLQRVN